MEKTLRMLVVDDEVINRTILNNIFESDFSIMEAANGEEALELLELNGPVDIVLLDLMMPKMNGFDLLTILKETKKYHNMPVIVNTQYGETENEIKALELGAEDFISKPYDERVVRQRVSNIVKRSLYIRREVEDAVQVLKEHTSHDYVTGLLNRAEYYRRARQFITMKKDEQCVICVLNIDRFKVVNELYGSTKGDMVLSSLGRKVCRMIGGNGVSGRLEADRFVFCTTKKYFDEIIPQIEEVLTGGGNWNPLDYSVQSHMGIFLVEDPNMAVDIMCDRADMALQMIKESYIKRYSYYSDELKTAILSEQELVNEMEEALDKHQFVVVLQPIVEAATGRTASAEALIRWKHPVKGMISPGFFLPLFEKNGFIAKLDLFVCEEVCKFQKDRIEKGLPTVPISVNISRVNFYRPEFAREVKNMTERYEISNDLIKLEITEGAYEDKPMEMIEAIKDFQKSSFKILMDDFGSGYSSLNTLKEFNVDILKIDMKFINDMETSERANNILFSIFRMAEALNMETVAEGVETKEQLEQLREYECDYIQGYFFSKPISQEEFSVRLEEEKNVTFSRNVDNRRQILIVDDQIVERQIMKKLVGDKYRVVEASNGREALEILKRKFESISLVISDMQMPEMGGLELLSAMSDSMYLREIPVIMVTAYGDRKNEEAALTRGALEIITKPYDGTLVRKRIENILKISETEAKVKKLQSLWEQDGN